MVATDADASKAYELYKRLEQNAPDAWLDGKPWIEIALTQAVLLLADEDAVYVQVDTGADPASERLILITGTSVFIVEPADGGAGVRTTLVPRSAVESLVVVGGDPVIYDAASSRLKREAQKWPGSIEVEVTYRGVTSPIQLKRGSNDRFNELAPFLAELKRDLAGQGTTAGAA